ncbi:hypothetical protein [Nocardia asiatica]|uniref:hypothetical protein n=1 Tax=Nocardia asiatica TaxID=209252 RepID=UPI0024575EA7|nr:hypothetical protein [Nocardia asiatica]
MTDVATIPAHRDAADHRWIEVTVDRLCLEFGHQVSRRWVGRVVRRCVRDLAGSPVGGLPELSERLARQRLLDDGRREGRQV